MTKSLHRIATMPRDSGPPLPRWARIVKQQDDQQREPLEPEQEEVYLRTRLHGTMARRVDDAIHAALQSQVSPVVKDIAEFFQMTSPSNVDDFQEERPSKRARKSDDDALAALFAVEPPKRYPVTLLPLANVHGPYSFLDRQEMMKYMVKSMRLNKEKLGPAVCWLQSAQNSSIRHCGSFLQEILRQCIAQEPNPHEFQRLFDRTKVSNSSFAQALVTWAQYTVSFDSIIVFLDTVECMPGPLFQDFLRILTLLRSEHRLPLCVVLLSPPGRARSLGLDSSAQGTAGILVRDFCLPTSKLLYDFVWNQVFVKHPLPMSLDPSVLRSIRESFDHQHSSAIRATQMLKQALAHSCTPRGAFLLGKSESSFLEDEERRIRYFESHHHSDTTLEFAKDEMENHSIQSTIVRLLHKVGMDVGSNSPGGIEWAEQEFSSLCFNAVRSRLCKHFIGLPHLEKMAWLVGLRRELERIKSSSEKIRDLILQLNEIIILTDERERLKDSEFVKDLSELFSEWICKVSVVGATIQTRQTDDSNRFSPATKADTTVDAIVPQVRGQITEAMLNPSSNVDEKSNLNVPLLIFSLMKDRVVVSREECFEAFVKHFNGSSSLEELCSVFAFGIHQLCYCGLIKEKLGSKNNVLYERTALVWCSGR